MTSQQAACAAVLAVARHLADAYRFTRENPSP